jgi:hypothetical protein
MNQRTPIDNRTPAQRERQRDVILMVIAGLHELHRAGLANVKTLPAMTAQGFKRVTDLNAGGFTPTDIERRAAMTFLSQRYGIDFARLHETAH